MGEIFKQRKSVLNLKMKACHMASQRYSVARVRAVTCALYLKSKLDIINNNQKDWKVWNFPIAKNRADTE